MIDDPKPEDKDATEQAKEMEEVQEDAAKEREETAVISRAGAERGESDFVRNIASRR
jgi:hypothetical protein